MNAQAQRFRSIALILKSTQKMKRLVSGRALAFPSVIYRLAVARSAQAMRAELHRPILTRRTVLSAIAMRLAAISSMIANAAYPMADVCLSSLKSGIKQLPPTLGPKRVRVFQVNQSAQGLHHGQ
jgi:hypothetical protein